MMAPLFAASCAAARINEENKSKGVSCLSVVVSTCQISEHGGDALLSVLHARVSCFTNGGRTTKVKYKGSIQTSDPPHTLITYLNICWLSSILASSVIFWSRWLVVQIHHISPIKFLTLPPFEIIIFYSLIYNFHYISRHSVYPDT